MLWLASTCNFYSHAVGLMVEMSDRLGLRCDSRVLSWFARSARLKAQHCVELFSWCYTTHEREQVRIPTVQDLKKKKNNWWITDDSWEARDDAGVCTLQVFQSISWVKLQVCVRQTFWKKKQQFFYLEKKITTECFALFTHMLIVFTKCRWKGKKKTFWHCCVTSFCNSQTFNAPWIEETFDRVYFCFSWSYKDLASSEGTALKTPRTNYPDAGIQSGGWFIASP